MKKNKKKSTKTETKTSGSAQQQGLTKAEKRSLGADAKKFRKAWERAAGGDILARYALGESALAVEAKYGKQGKEVLAQAIDRSVALVYSYGAVVKTWTRAELRKLLKEAKGNLEWSHLVALSNQTRVDAASREALLKQIIAEKMTTTALSQMLNPHGATTDSVDSDLIEDGAVESHGAVSGTKTALTEAASGTGADAPAAAVDESEAEDGEEENPIANETDPTPTVTKQKVTLTRRAHSLRRYASTLSAFAGQAKLVNQVFEGFEEALRSEKASEAIDATLGDLASTKKAAEDAVRFNQATIKKVDELMDAAKAELALRNASQPPVSDPNPVQISGTQAEA